MTTTTSPLEETGGSTLPKRARALMRDYPIIPLVFLLLLLVAMLQVLNPGIVLDPEGLLGLNDRWISNTVKFAVPLAILAASQTLTMITGGIDLSVGIVATMTAFVTTTQVASGVDPVLAIPLALGCAALAGLASGIGVAIFRVHPLIMTLAVALVAEGLLLVYQRFMLGISAEIPEVITWLGTGRSFDIVPNSLLVFVPLALIVGFTLRRTGFGRNLYAIGDNERAARLAGVRVWQVLIVLYVVSAIIAGIGGLVYVGLIKATTLSLAVPLMLPSVAATVIGGVSIFGGRGGYLGVIVGALILQVMDSMLTVLRIEEGTRRVIYGLIILGITALYVRITQESTER
jgi:ribose transport system permease protein